MSIPLCANCGHQAIFHCKRHLLPCCPTKCSYDVRVEPKPEDGIAMVTPDVYGSDAEARSRIDG